MQAGMNSKAGRSAMATSLAIGLAPDGGGAGFCLGADLVAKKVAEAAINPAISRGTAMSATKLPASRHGQT